MEKKPDMELHKNAAYCFQQIQNAASYKLTIVHKLSKQFEQDKMDIVWEVKMNL